MNRIQRGVMVWLILGSLLVGVAGAGADADGPPQRALWTGQLDYEPFSWLDSDLERRLLEGESIPIDDIPGFPYTSKQLVEAQECAPVCPALPYTHIRPGAALGLPQLSCTANFVFESGDRLAIGTAGHCTRMGDEHQTLLVNPEHGLSFPVFGETIYTRGGGVGSDFALIEIDPSYHDRVDPAVSTLDGPCGWRNSDGYGDPIQFYGHAQGWGAGGQPRAGYVEYEGRAFNGGWFLQYTRYPSGGGGDSGAPVVYVVGETGMREAAAVHTHGSDVLGLVGTPTIGLGTSMKGVFRLLDRAGLDDWELVDSRNCPIGPWPPVAAGTNL